MKALFFYSLFMLCCCSWDSANKEKQQNLSKSFSHPNPIIWGTIENAMKTPNNITGVILYDIKTLPVEIYVLRNLRGIVIYGGEINDIPKKLIELSELQFFAAVGTEMINFENLAYLSKLETLYLTNNKIVKIPQSFSNLKNLKNLVLDDNHIENFAFLQEMNSVKQLSLNRMGLKSIPNQIFNLKNIDDLSMNNNRIIEVDEKIIKMKNLSKLSIAMNQIRLLPKNINLLNNLSYLDISLNKLVDLSMLFIKMDQLKQIRIGGNNVPINNIGELEKLYKYIDTIPNEDLYIRQQFPKVD